MNPVDQLRSESPKARLEAVRSISAAPCDNSAKLLSQTLDDKDRLVCETALNALETLGGDDAVEALILALGDERDWLRDAIDKTLERINPEWAKTEIAQVVIAGFFTDLSSDDSPLRDAAEAALQRPGDPRAARQLRDAIIRRGAEGVALTLERRVELKAPPPLLELLVDPVPIRRKLAFETLNLINPYWKEDVAAQANATRIAEGLQSPEPGMRECCAEILAALGSKETIPALIGALAMDGFVRNAAEAALDAIDPDWPQLPEAARVAQTCIERLKTDSPSSRFSALLTLRRIGSEETAPHFAWALIDENPRVRSEASACLERLAPDWKRNKLAKLAVPIAISALSHANEDVRRDAQRLLGEIGGRPAVKALIDQLATTPEAGLMKALGAIGDSRAITPLVSALLQGSSFLHRHAVAALEAIDPAWTESEAVREMKPAFLRELREAETPDTRAAAARALGEVGGEEALDPLRAAAAGDPEPDVRRDAGKASERLRQRLREAKSKATG